MSNNLAVFVGALVVLIMIVIFVAVVYAILSWVYPVSGFEANFTLHKILGSYPL